jgi:hypothetical protein
MIERLQNWLITEWRSAYKFWSVRLSALGLAIMGAWPMIPPELRAMLPYQQHIAMIMFGLIILSRITAQAPKA